MRSLLQFTLDLFAPTSPAPAPVPPPRVRMKKKLPRAQVNPAQIAPELIANTVAGSAVADVFSAPPFRHPYATRELLLGTTPVAFEFQRAKRRSIGFVVGPLGLVVRAPRWVPLAEVDAAVRDKARWIVQKLEQARERQAEQQATRIAWHNGTELPYLGQTLVLVLDPQRRGSALLGNQLCLGLPLQASAQQIRAAAHKWLLAQARAFFIQRLQHYAPQLGVQWRQLALSNAATRWGSASSTGSIRLNWRLMHHRPEVVDYVVVHELSHLRYMDHSPRFWDTVGAVMPGYPALRAELRSVVIPKWEEAAA
jgi:predicted metal-dependent hydrolase